MPEIPEITENLEVLLSELLLRTPYYLSSSIISCLYCSLPLLSPMSIVLTHTIGGVPVYLPIVYLLLLCISIVLAYYTALKPGIVYIVVLSCIRLSK